LPTFLYGKDEHGLFVNQYSDSTVEVKLADGRALRIRQEATYPAEETIRMTIEAAPEQPVAIRFRLPGWCKTPQLIVNGQSQSGLKPGSYQSVERRWKKGDQIKLVFPMELQWVQSDASWKTSISRLPGGELIYKADKDGDRPWALTRGPLVYAVDTLWWSETNGLPPAQVGDDLAIVPDVAAVQEAVRPKGVFGPAYTVEGRTVAGRKVRPLVVPFTNIGRWYRDGQPRPGRDEAAYSYAIWLLNTNAAAFEQRVQQAARQQAKLSKAIDYVLVGDQASETSHRVQGGDTGIFNDNIFRHGKSFSYQVKINPNRPSKLVVTYWGGDENRVFDVLVNGRVLGTQSLQKNKPGSFFDEAYVIPPDLVRGQTDQFGQPVEFVTVQFKAKNQNVAGGVFGLVVE
jgi:hypothetical protein